MLCKTLAHAGYYHKFMCRCTQITTQKLLNKDTLFVWIEKCQRSFDELKEKLVIVPILVFLDWAKEFHVHVDGSSIALGAILAQPRDGEIDHLVAFASRKLSTVEKNYTTTKREGLTMVYCM